MQASNWLGCSDAGPDAGVLVAAPPTVTLGEKQSFGFVTVKFRFSPEQSAELGGADGIKTKLKKAFEQEDPKSCNKMVFTSPREKDKSVCGNSVAILTGTHPKTSSFSARERVRSYGLAYTPRTRGIQTPTRGILATAHLCQRKKTPSRRFPDR